MRRASGRGGALASGRSRALATAVAALLAACGGDEVPEGANGGAGTEAAAPAPADRADSSTRAGGEPAPSGDDAASTGVPPSELVSPPPPDLTSPEAVSAIGRLLDSLFADGFASEPVAATPGDAANVARFAGDSLLAQRFAARPRLRLGTQLRATSDRFVTTADHRPGDPVAATLAEDVPGPGGRVLVRRGAKLLGVVTASQSAFGPGETAFLEVSFLTLTADTWERPIKTRVVAVLSPEELEPTPDSAQAPPESRPDSSAVPSDPVEEAPGEIPAGAVLVVELEEPVALPMSAGEEGSAESAVDPLPSTRDTTRIARPD